MSGCGNPNPGKVLLTFDDGGPKAGAILAVLDRYNIKARWFPTGQWAGANGAFIQRLIADGQMLGNHSYSHPQMFASLGRTELARQVDQGYHPSKVFRFPYGASDATSRSIVTSRGYSICGWSIDTLDWRGNSADTITQIVTSQARPGAVVLMHLSFQNDVDALPRIIVNLRGRGLISARSGRPGRQVPPAQPVAAAHRLRLGRSRTSRRPDAGPSRVTPSGARAGSRGGLLTT